MKRTDLPIDAPCSKDWDTMTPAGLKRFCSDCKKHVHDMAGMTRAQAGEFLSDHAGQHLCVRYAVADAGALLFAPRELISATSLLPSVRALAAATAMVAGAYAYQHAAAPHRAVLPLLNVRATIDQDLVVDQQQQFSPAPWVPDPWTTPSPQQSVNLGAVYVPAKYKSETVDPTATPAKKSRKAAKPTK